MKILGIVGWSGSGKTTLITKLIPVLRARGMRVATLKHAHHAFDVDTPAAFDRVAGTQEVHRFLTARLGQMSQATAITLTGSNGQVVNTTRQWPRPAAA